MTTIKTKQRPQIYAHTMTIDGQTWLLGATETALVFVGFPDQAANQIADFFPEAEILPDTAGYTVAAGEALQAYLAGDQMTWSLPWQTAGTPFQERVWAQLRQIPYGTTTTYQEIASAIGQPGASRAVGSAVAANPLLLLIPCHRVVPQAGGVGQYRGGAALKQQLLALEARSR